MHPDQFTLINALDSEIIIRSKSELLYHTEFLDLLNLDKSAKIQIHVGGAYGNKEESIKRFIKNYFSLEERIKERLTIENDDRLFTVDNCLRIHQETGLPVLFDSFHHTILNNGESIHDALKRCSHTWKKQDGLPMVDYSSQNESGRPGNHTQHIDSRDFKLFLSQIKEVDCDIMLEIKDKEESALKAIQILKLHHR
jgi:UV DNA damage endonuclease